MPDLLKELSDISCRCGLWKRSGHTLCRQCFRSLPFNLRDDLYLLAGSGYEEAYNKAKDFLIKSGRWSDLEL